MKKTVALVAAGLVALVVLAKTTNVGSYVCTAWSQAKHAAKAQVPTKFEIERIRHEIASLDHDLDRMIRPIAEHKVTVERLRQEIAEKDTKLADQKKVLLDATTAVKTSGKKELVYNGKAYPVEQVKAQIARDFEAYKRAEATLAAKRQSLESKEATLRAAQEKLQAFISMKREFEVQLTQLEAEHEINLANAVGNDIKIDTTRASSIAAALAELKTTIQTDTVQIEMEKGVRAAGSVPLNQPQATVGVDLDAIQAHLEGNVEPKKGLTVSTK
jgi:chromosome segregation ATPase